MQHAQLSLLLTSLSTVLILLFFDSTLSLTVIMCLTCSVTNEVMLALRQMESQQAQRRAVRDFWCIYFINLNKNSILHIYVLYYGFFFLNWAWNVLCNNDTWSLCNFAAGNAVS